MSDKEMTTEQWLAIRKQAGLQIDPETAEVHWQYGQVADPLRRRSRPARGIPMCRAQLLRPFSWERRVG
jgi:hypothetical protein